MKISVRDRGLSDSYLKHVTQLGADCIDFGSGTSFPGVTEQGPALDEVIKIRKGTRHRPRGDTRLCASLEASIGADNAQSLALDTDLRYQAGSMKPILCIGMARKTLRRRQTHILQSCHHLGRHAQRSWDVVPFPVPSL